MVYSKYKTFIFDCDGVVLNSNQVKTQAFYNAAIGYGHEAAAALRDYHVRNGGISRYKKFEYFLKDIIKKEIIKDELHDLLNSFAGEVKKGLINCELAEGLIELRGKTQGVKWMIVSGGDQNELQNVFGERSIAYLFNGGIFGSPDTKDEILKRELLNGNIVQPAVFFGDSLYDFEASSRAGFDFIFVSGWTEVKEWRKWINEYQIHVIDRVADILG